MVESHEQWRPIAGCEGLYSVSDRGRVRSERRIVMRSNGVPQRINERILRQQTEEKGHKAVHIRVDGVRVVLKVHQLVLEAFVGPRPPGMVACHYDDDKENNQVSNLRWATYSDNMSDQIRNGTHYQLNKTHCPLGHPYNDANTLVYTRPGGRPDRRCRTCLRARAKKYRASKRAA
ncbi:NUMOD4 motif-containing HNH endonuclease [Nocardia otitidiscaviarum]|uniref:NUMOD4 motif-containing HNH endonuclease n=1 Tax=Nocardia otitidiscaviarum TaxID=1823 RepID=UPI0005BE8442